ncbi:MAG: AsmA family protein [Pseudomonadota bacterium]|nr:AsmA family protein [Pseudomonadota bacterium]
MLGYLAALAALVLAAGAVYLVGFLDLNAYKPRLAALAEQHTGRRLNVEGDISVVLLPAPGVSIAGPRLASAPGFDAAPLAAAETVTIGVELLPLLRRQLRIRRIHVDGLRLDLVRNKAGETNWSGVQEALTAPAGEAAPPAVTVQGLDLTGTRLRYEDQGTGLTGEARFSARVTADAAQRRFAIDRTAVDLRLAGPRLPQEGVQGRLLLAAAADLDQGQVTAEGRLKLINVVADGELDAAGVGGSAQVNGRLTVQEFSPRRLLAELGMAPDTRDGSVLAAAALELGLQGDRRQWTIEPQGRFDDTRISGRVTVTNPADPAIRFDLTLDRLNLDRYQPPPRDPILEPDNAEPAWTRLRDLDLRGNLRIGRLTLDGQSSRDVVIRVQWDPG